jgi:hypothetical protein
MDGSIKVSDWHCVTDGQRGQAHKMISAIGSKKNTTEPQRSREKP